MLKRDITFEDFDGNTVTETHYFNISKPELIELEVEYKQGLSTMIQEIIKAEDNKTIVKLFKRIILLAYGERSEDGKRFIKSDEISEAFSQTNAYNRLFMELIENEGVAAEFLIGTLPADMTGQVKAAISQTADPTAIPQTS